MTSAAAAGAGPVREEDAFDVQAVTRWLRGRAPEAVAGGEDPVQVRQFASGASNLTYLLRYPAGDLVLRRPPAGQKARGAHDMAREYRIQERLQASFPYVPPMVALCEDPAVIGAPFYVMRRVEGAILRRDLPAGTSPSPEQVRRLCAGFWDRLVELHSVDVAASGLGDLAKGSGYVGRQVRGWTERFRRARTDDVGDFETVVSWLAARQPGDVAACVIHNDYRLDNVVLGDDLAVRAVLDWEMATVGDPLMDLGGALAYWVEAGDDRFCQLFRRQPSHAAGMFTREEIVDHYASRTGRWVSAEAWRFYEVFGLFRLAAIAQQIYYRYAHRQTTNEAFAVFGPAVRHLEQRCRDLIG